MNGLYAICDLDFLESRGVDPLRYSAALLAARPAALQLRAKRAPAAQVVQLLRALVQPCREQHTPLFANDRPDLALLAGADGVHVGQEDLTVQQVRAFDTALRVGVSTHTLEQLSTALAARPDYVAFGPIFDTASKQDPDTTVGLETLEQASDRSRQAGIPLVAIGGIDLIRLPLLRGKADAVASISGLFPGSAAAANPAQLWSAVTHIAQQYQSALQRP